LHRKDINPLFSTQIAIIVEAAYPNGSKHHQQVSSPVRQWVLSRPLSAALSPSTRPRGYHLRRRDTLRAFITEAVEVRATLTRIGEPTTPPQIAPARGPPSWYQDFAADAIDAKERLTQPATEYDQRLSW
jgi:hypothetical protein